MPVARRAARLFFLGGIAALPVMHPLHIHVLGALLIPADLCFAASGVAWLLAALRGQVRVQPRAFSVAVVLYLVVVAVSGARDGTTTAFDHVLIGFYVGALAILAANLVPDVVSLDSAVLAWIAGGAIAVASGLAGIALFYAGRKTTANNFALFPYADVPVGNYPRVDGVFFNANFFCNYLVVTGLLLLAAIECAWVPARTALAGLALLVVVAVFSMSPGLGGLALAGGLWVWASPTIAWSSPVRRVALALGATGAVAFGVLTCISLDLGAGLSTSARVHAWHQAAVSFLRHPILGAGLGRTIVSVTDVTPSGLAAHLADAHNTWLSIAAHTGLLAVLAFAAVVVVALGQKLSLRERDPVRRALVIALVGAFLYQGLSMSMEEMRHLWLLLALLAAAGGRTPARNDAVSVGRGVASTR